MIASLLHNICLRVMANLSENDYLLQNLQETDQRERKEGGRKKKEGKKEEVKEGGKMKGMVGIGSSVLNCLHLIGHC